MIIQTVQVGELEEGTGASTVDSTKYDTIFFLFQEVVG